MSSESTPLLITSNLLIYLAFSFYEIIERAPDECEMETVWCIVSEAHWRIVCREFKCICYSMRACSVALASAARQVQSGTSKNKADRNCYNLVCCRRYKTTQGKGGHPSCDEFCFRASRLRLFFTLAPAIFSSHSAILSETRRPSNHLYAIAVTFIKLRSGRITSVR